MGSGGTRLSMHTFLLSYKWGNNQTSTDVQTGNTMYDIRMRFEEMARSGEIIDSTTNRANTNNAFRKEEPRRSTIKSRRSNRPGKPYITYMKLLWADERERAMRSENNIERQCWGMQRKQRGSIEQAYQQMLRKIVHIQKKLIIYVRGRLRQRIRTKTYKSGSAKRFAAGAGPDARTDQQTHNSHARRHAWK